jgi:NTP pyrophosphatase (non-canonical NTP hydrolase)
MHFDEYQRQAQETDQLPQGAKVENGDKEQLIPFLGMAGEVGSLLSEYKKLLRDGPIHSHFKDQVREELGDVLWYVANVAAKFGLSMEDVAKENLQKTRDRWLAQRERKPRIFDADYLQTEQLPRQFEYVLTYGSDENGVKKVMVCDTSGKQVGNFLTDNALEEDGYRFHDALHLAHAALIGWSPVFRKLLGRKRRSVGKVDEVEDGGRAGVIDEALVAIEFEYARRHNMFEGAKTVDWELLRTIKRLTDGLEIRVITANEWEQAILQGFKVWREIRRHDGGIVRGDMISGSFEFSPLPASQKA